ncbi:transposase [Bradyrhizobium sp. CB3481]|uniref:transposase n=1 Tax=Bradyrhizobium sp. CB3481 TaxID=3039158 RepID=UPI0024B0C1DF|nr:transposase [Bradyrhizobium sp. CB3481]WFU14853.1 transposase [Bradyrhizobium sp. CB3481]
MEETLVPGAVVSEIARGHGLTPQQVFTWRRQARRQPPPMADDPQFVPAWWLPLVLVVRFVMMVVLTLTAFLPVA